MRLPDFWTGLAFCLFGVAIAFQAQSFHVPAGAASPRLFPTIVGVAMAAMGAAVTFRGLRTAGEFWFPRWLRSPQQISLVLWLPAAVVLFAVLAPQWGTIAVSVPLLIIHCLLYGLSLPKSLGVGLVAGVTIPLIFIHFLGVPLPYGLFEELL